MSGTAAPWERYAQQAAPVEAVDPPWMRYAVPQQGMSTMETVTGLAQKAGNGLTFGFGDELMSGAQATIGSLTGDPRTWGDQYDAALQRNRSRMAATEKEMPVASAVAQAGGAFANPATRLGAGQTFIGRAVSNGLINGALGGVAGFGEGEGGFANRAGSAGLGAATGAAIGAVLPPVAEGVGKLAKAVAPYLGLNVARTDAERRIIEALKNGGTSVDDVKARLDPITGQPMAMADVGGEDLLGLAQYVARKPGPSMSAARNFVEERGGLNQSGRLQGEIDRAISSGDWKSTVDDLIATRSRTADPLYTAVRNDPSPVNVAPILKDIDARLETAKGPIRDALRRAKSLFLNRNGAPDTTLGGLHETKIALDAMMDWGAEKSIDKFARMEVKEVQKKLLAEMDAASKGQYAAARDAFAGPSQAKNAMELGKSLLKGSDFDETADAIAKLSASEKDFFRIGVARTLDDAVKGKLDTADLGKVRKLWGSQAVRERVGAAFDNPAEFKQFSEFMDREMNIALTNAAVDPRGNSVTAKILMRDAQPAPDGPLFRAMKDAVQGRPASAISNLMPRASTGELSADTAAEIAPYVFSLKAGDRARLLDALAKRQSRDDAMLPWGKRLGAAVLRGGTAGLIGVEN